eukprot:TRINITY_DN17309_c0_g1_i1.p1 TRINITY_DN17309_c0_g1~~TRINITY_DN17309_c0_g1_i1.p1  ORF type:complete len:1124 (+),score=193.13 TRINITY_DN17309_c0_g1_i1:22-3372(+)
MEGSHLDAIPAAVLVHIFHYVPPEHLITRVSPVCSDWHTIIFKPSTWRSICIVKWGRPERNTPTEPTTPIELMKRRIPFEIDPAKVSEEEGTSITAPYLDVDPFQYFWYRKLHEEVVFNLYNIALERSKAAAARAAEAMASAAAAGLPAPAIPYIPEVPDTPPSTEVTLLSRNTAMELLLTFADDTDEPGVADDGTVLLDKLLEQMPLYARYVVLTAAHHPRLRALAIMFFNRLFSIADSRAPHFRRMVSPTVAQRILRFLLQCVDSEFCQQPASRPARESLALALEALAACCDVFAKALRRQPTFFLDNVAPMLIMGISNVMDGMFDHAQSFMESQPCANILAEEVLDRIALSLGGEVTTPVVSNILISLIEAVPATPEAVDEDWRLRYARLKALALTAEACREQLKAPQRLSVIMTVLIHCANYPHAMVRWAAFNAIGQLSTDLESAFQEHGSSSILPLFVDRLQSEPTTEVLTHICASIVNFMEHASDLPKETILALASAVLERMGTQNAPELRSQAMTAFASMADGNSEALESLYPRAMALLAETLTQLRTVLCSTEEGEAEDGQGTEEEVEIRRKKRKQSEDLLSKAIECTSILGRSGGPSVFTADAPAAIQEIIRRATEPNLKRNMMRCTLQAVARFLDSKFDQSKLPEGIRDEAMGAAVRLVSSLLRDEAIDDDSEEDGVELALLCLKAFSANGVLRELLQRHPGLQGELQTLLLASLDMTEGSAKCHALACLHDLARAAQYHPEVDEAAYRALCSALSQEDEIQVLDTAARELKRYEKLAWQEGRAAVWRREALEGLTLALERAIGGVIGFDKEDEAAEEFADWCQRFLNRFAKACGVLYRRHLWRTPGACRSIAKLVATINPQEAPPPFQTSLILALEEFLEQACALVLISRTTPRNATDQVAINILTDLGTGPGTASGPALEDWVCEKRESEESVARVLLSSCMALCSSSAPPGLLQAASYGIGLVAQAVPEVLLGHWEEAISTLQATRRGVLRAKGGAELARASDNVTSAITKVIAALPEEQLLTPTGSIALLLKGIASEMPLRHDEAERPACGVALAAVVRRVSRHKSSAAQSLLSQYKARIAEALEGVPSDAAEEARALVALW